MPVQLYNITNVDFVINGTLLLSKNIWQKDNIEAFILLEYVENITFSGTGLIDGQGYMWWVREYLQKNLYGRPRIIRIKRCRNFEWSGVKLLNSPYYHILALDIDGAYFHDFEIEVDVMG